MGLSEIIHELTRGGGNVRFAQSGDGTQCWARRHHETEDHDAVGETPEEAMLTVVGKMREADARDDDHTE